MKELVQFICAAADLALHKVGVFLRSRDPDFANVTGAEPTFEEMEAFLTHLAEVPESIDNANMLRWALEELGELESWQFRLILMWCGDQITNGPDGGNHMVSLSGQDQFVVRSLGRKR